MSSLTYCCCRVRFHLPPMFQTSSTITPSTGSPHLLGGRRRLPRHASVIRNSVCWSGGNSQCRYDSYSEDLGGRAMSTLLELNKYGQSYWIDNLTRDMLDSGELARRVNKEGLCGVTSNPTIFEHAI